MIGDLIQLLSHRELSDILLFIAAPLALWFALDYGLLSPWYKHPLGVITLLTALSVSAALLLIVYAMVVGERIPEPIRAFVGFALVISYVSKVVILKVERRNGRIERRRSRRHQEHREEVNHGD